LSLSIVGIADTFAAAHHVLFEFMPRVVEQERQLDEQGNVTVRPRHSGLDDIDEIGWLDHNRLCVIPEDGVNSSGMSLGKLEL